MSQAVIDRSFRPLLGQPCWGLHYEPRLNLSINFGRPALRVREPYDTDSKSDAVRRMASRRQVTVRGRWWLWLYNCRWRIVSGGLTLATGSSSLRKIERAVSQLAGQALNSVQVEPVTGSTCFTFDLGCVLHCRRFERGSDAELWLLYRPSGFVLSVYGDGTIGHRHESDIMG